MTWKTIAAAALAAIMMTLPALAQTPDEMVKAAQQALKDKGHDPGTVDGRMGPKTEAAVRDFQKAQGLQTNGELDDTTIQALVMDDART
jgi:peptidoglycan hydrolase-like protein with peptidoglycan-binding domain